VTARVVDLCRKEGVLGHDLSQRQADEQSSGLPSGTQSGGRWGRDDEAFVDDGGLLLSSGPIRVWDGSLKRRHVTATASNGAEYVADVGNGARGTIRVPVGKYAVTAQSGSALCVAQIVVAVSGSSQVVTVGCSVK
jgi:hypothetical protein